MKINRWPKTDLGTIILHWTAAVAFVWLFLTGLRIASDNPGLSWLATLDAFLPVENLWPNHMLAALVLSATMIGYGVYVAKSRLHARIKIDSSRLQGLFLNTRARWACFNVLLYWIFFVSLIASAASGWILYLDPGSLALDVHLTSLWILAAFPALHLVIQLRLGGFAQIVRIFRPSPLPAPVPEPDLAAVVADLLAAQKIREAAPAQVSSRNGELRR